MENCIFCNIAAGKIGSLIFEDDELAAFHDINPEAPVHVLVVPKRHLPDLNESEGEGALLGRMCEAAIMLAGQLKVAEGGYRLVMNCGFDGGQSVKHIHLHLLGGRSFAWPPG